MRRWDIPRDGSANGWATLQREFNAGAAVYPIDPLLRVSGIKRSFWAGLGGQSLYQAELALGGMSITYVSPISSREPPSAVTPEPTPSGPGYSQEDYETWLRKNDVMAMLKIFGHIPSYAEWVKWRQKGGLAVLGLGPLL